MSRILSILLFGLFIFSSIKLSYSFSNIRECPNNSIKIKGGECKCDFGYYEFKNYHAWLCLKGTPPKMLERADKYVCQKAVCNQKVNGKIERKFCEKTKYYNYKYVFEAKRRGLKCGILDNVDESEQDVIKMSLKEFYASWTDKKICRYIKEKYDLNGKVGKFIFSEATRRNLDCKVKEDNKITIASKPKITKPSISSEELNNEKEKRIELQRKAKEEERKRKALEQRIAELEKKNKELQQPKKIKQKPSNEIGSGFYVSKFRHIVTNQHVVKKCEKITVGDSMTTQIPADLIASDKRNDLAILQTVSMEMASSDTKSFIQKLKMEIGPIVSGGLMRSDDVVGGEEIFVAGFPLANQISDSLKLSDGIVSSTKGYENDVSKFEITSVVRKGNSGGPIYDSKGNIVGVVVEQVNVSRSDNVNFAIKGSTVKQFLSAHNVPTKWSNRKDNIDTKDIYKIASKQTVMVVCHR